MEVAGIRVRHTTFGEGTVISQTNERMITVSFLSGEKRFVFPECFQSNLVAIDENVQQLMLEKLREKKVIELEEQAERKVQEEIELEKARMIREKHRNLFARKQAAPKSKRAKLHSRSNIAFKCNYSDGGQSDTRIGYDGICSEDIIYNNVVIEKRAWCAHENCMCRQYIDEEMTYAELEQWMQEDNFVCYESQLLKQWTAFAGYKHYGSRAGEPMKIQKVQINSLCILTTREPQTSESQRFIFAVFIVGERFEGNEDAEGYVQAHPIYHLVLPPALAKQMLFWNYYTNTNNPQRAAWNSMLFRYLDDSQSVHILRDIVALTSGTKEETLAQDMLTYYIQKNGVSEATLAPKAGALTYVAG